MNGLLKDVRTMRAVKVKLEFHWGFISRRPTFTAAQPSTVYPTLTSLIGALAYGLAKLKGVPEVLPKFMPVRKGKRVNLSYYSSAIRVLDYCSWVTYRIDSDLEPNLGLVETMDLSKVSLVLGIRRGNIYPGSPYLWGVQPHGKVYAPTLKLTVTYFPRRPEAVNELKSASWLITRVGSRESVVSVNDVRLVDANIVDIKEVSTKYTLPRETIEFVNGRHLITGLFVPSEEWFNLMTVKDVSKHITDFVIPLELVKVKISPRALVIIDEEGDAYVLPKDRVEQAR